MIYATVLRRVCETVTASTSEAVETGSMSSGVEITLTSALATRQASAETIDAPKAIETSTFDSGSTTTSSEATAPTTAEPNGDNEDISAPASSGNSILTAAIAALLGLSRNQAALIVIAPSNTACDNIEERIWGVQQD
ncbi:hypothetical protein FPOAC1_008672 [Fusarium poae]|uniref:hypothetical protein n=1 Tax=Fusarium poae TaxID=36050 RepID=UPI001CEBC2E1|nr:hypothetical protein FPOAC1_008672 [Fusarium poae]KAG8669283.1 hypothetical protein FPOAC1_008672 [Fusarium poae]